MVNPLTTELYTKSNFCWRIRADKICHPIIFKYDWTETIHNQKMKILQEGNTCADYLAKFRACNPETYSPIVIPPNEVSLLLLADTSGTYFLNSFLLFIFFLSFPFLVPKKYELHLMSCLVFPCYICEEIHWYFIFVCTRYIVG
jgi:hypothetical protein